MVAVSSTTSAPARANATTQAPPAPPAISINAGGGAVSGFVADVDFAGGGLYSSSAPVNVAGVANAAPAAVYQDERQGEFVYTVPGFVKGSSHTVLLHFAELYFTQPGARKFNVSVNGAPVLTDFDIVQAAGAANKAVVQQVPATADANGQIVIRFSRGSVDQPAVNALVIR